MILPTLDTEELQSLSKQEVQIEITVQEEKLAKMKPNMAAISEYRNKVTNHCMNIGQIFFNGMFHFDQIYFM